jgi:hypothetical protein
MTATIPLPVFRAELASLMAASRIAMIPGLETDFSVSFHGPSAESLGDIQAHARAQFTPLLFSTHLDDFLERADSERTNELYASPLIQGRHMLMGWLQTPLGEVFSGMRADEGELRNGEVLNFRRAPRSIDMLTVEQIAPRIPGQSPRALSCDAIRDAAYELIVSLAPSWRLLHGCEPEHDRRDIIPQTIQRSISRALPQGNQRCVHSAIDAARRLFVSGLLLTHLGDDSNMRFADLVFFYSAKLLQRELQPDAAAMAIELISDQIPVFHRQWQSGWTAALSKQEEVFWKLGRTADIYVSPSSAEQQALRITQGLLHALAFEDWRAAFDCYQVLRLVGPEGTSAEAAWRHDLRSAFSLALILEFKTTMTAGESSLKDRLQYVLDWVASGIELDGQHGHLDQAARKLADDVPRISSFIPER